jgi:RAB protein geranylgeranyltransferase component A
MYSSAESAIHKMPVSDVEALKSGVMGIWEKKKDGWLYKSLERVIFLDSKIWAF